MRKEWREIAKIGNMKQDYIDRAIIDFCIACTFKDNGMYTATHHGNVVILNERAIQTAADFGKL